MFVGIICRMAGGMMEKSKSFSVGQMVECTPKYNFGSPHSNPTLIYPFEGIGIIIELDWPDTAHIYTIKGDVVCLSTDRLSPVKKEKK